MDVNYVIHMGDDLSVVNAARVSFAKLSNDLSGQDKKLIKYLADHNHWTPFGHTSITLRVKAPIFVARQLGKHQVGLVWNEVSRRYVDDEPEFYFPDEWRKRPKESIKQGSSGETVDRLQRPRHTMPIDAAVRTVASSCRKLYEDLLNSGVCPEQARMVLPQSMYTEWMWTGSVAAFARVCSLRLKEDSQRETREIAQSINDIVSELYPVSWEALRSSGEPSQQV